MSKKRQLLKQEETKKIILDVARDIVAKEGIQGLSIRKITNAIDYSPAIVYHYFKDKNEIIKSLVTEGYGQILNSIRSVARIEHEPEKELREIFTNYIQAALASPEVYKAFMLNDNPSVLTMTALLDAGISQRSPTMRSLCENIQRGIEQKRYVKCDPELTAQIIWTSTFGLIIKLIIEKNISSEQIECLINQHFTMLFNGLLTDAMKRRIEDEI